MINYRNMFHFYQIQQHVQMLSMLKLLVADQIILSSPQHVLSFPMKPEKKQSIEENETLCMQIIRQLSNNEEYHNNLPKSSFLHGDPQPNNNIGCISKNGCVFVMEGRLITFTHLQITFCHF